MRTSKQHNQRASEAKQNPAQQSQLSKQQGLVTSRPADPLAEVNSNRNDPPEYAQNDKAQNNRGSKEKSPRKDKQERTSMQGEGELQKSSRLSDAKESHEAQSSLVIENTTLDPQDKAQNQSMGTSRLILKKGSAPNSPKMVVTKNPQYYQQMRQYLTFEPKVSTLPNEQLEQLLPLDKKQWERLRLYFKYLSLTMCNYPKTATFDKVQLHYSTINLNQWMSFLRMVGLVAEFKKFKDGLKYLALIFRKHQDIDKRIDAQSFCLAVRECMLQVLQFKKSIKDKQRNVPPQDLLQQVIEMLHIDSKKSQIEVLRQMKVNCTEENLSMTRTCFNSLAKSNIYNTGVQKSPEKQMAANRSSDFSEKKPCTSVLIKNPIPKIYRTHNERRQSKLMHRLAVSNLDKLDPSSEMKESIGRFTDHDDRYLKEYFSRQEKVKEGYIRRLDKSIHAKTKKIKL